MSNYDLATGLFLLLYNGCAVLLIVIGNARHLTQIKVVSLIGWGILIAIQYMMWAGLGAFAR